MDLLVSVSIGRVRIRGPPNLVAVPQKTFVAHNNPSVSGYDSANRMSVDTATLFSMGEDQAVVVDGWLQTMKETNPSVVEKLQKCLGPGHFDDGAWQNLFPCDFQDSGQEKHGQGLCQVL